MSKGQNSTESRTEDKTENEDNESVEEVEKDE
jgi:hypothetical protein